MAVGYWGGLTALFLLAFTAPSPAQTTVRFNPVADRVELQLSVNDQHATVSWPGGGHLQHLNGRTWTLLARESPHLATRGQSAFFRVVDPWDNGRAVTVHVPDSYDAETPMPLIVLLHGFTSTGPQVEDWWRFRPLAASRGFLLAFPTGTRNPLDITFWNATPACCQISPPAVDDSHYLRAVIEGTMRRLNVDPKRIYFVGHSNGGFMSYRMACEHADLVAGVASLAGAAHHDPDACQPSEPVHVLQVHGTSDAVISYDGGATPWGPFPGALRTVEIWGAYNRSDDGLVELSRPTLDLDSVLPGADTTVLRDDSGDATVEHWRIENGAHSPTLKPDQTGTSTNFASLVIDWLLAHPKP